MSIHDTVKIKYYVQIIFIYPYWNLILKKTPKNSVIFTYLRKKNNVKFLYLQCWALSYIRSFQLPFRYLATILMCLPYT